MLRTVLNAFNCCVLTIVIFLTTSTNSDAAQHTECDLGVENSGALNASELWKRASSCAELNRKLDSTFLLLVGQIRAMADMSVLEPESDEEGVKVTDLYGVLFYQAGGSGYDEIYRNKASFEKLLNSVARWQATISDTYDPGWKIKRDVDFTFYTQMIECQRALRVSKLKWYASLIQDDEYFELHQQQTRLHQENQSTFEHGTTAYDKAQELSSKMNRISSQLPMPNSNPPECEIGKPYKPDPNANYRQVYTGYNGLKTSKASVYLSKDQILKSWIAKAVSKSELDKILSNVDFGSEIMVALNFGKRESATGSTYITDVKYNSVYKSLNVAGLIGVNERDCSKSHQISYPFVLAIAERPPSFPDYPSLYVQNFSDGCKDVISPKYFQVN